MGRSECMAYLRMPIFAVKFESFKRNVEVRLLDEGESRAVKGQKSSRWFIYLSEMRHASNF